MSEPTYAKFGWCIDRLHVDPDAEMDEPGVCPGSTSGGALRCSCDCHAGVHLPRAKPYRPEVEGGDDDATNDDFA